ncbi:hypothetical protein R5W24_005218 [Gemmata sp. JC717]|uniref:hypothetical protein n=1 Tax=Gemmata algarum TaxID=2975278 RepID=UPI0021BB3069|nr:hypothetical protein [Gemmata algarum]MDY3556055.1 hypothetical protein [Gemmata algarum]
MLIGLVINIFFLLTLSKALHRCHPDSRTMEPGMVWLALIPLVGIAWIFVNVLRVAESLRNEFRYRRWHRRGEDYGYGIGLAYCCLMLASIIPYCGSLFGLAGLVCWIMYWVKIANLSRQIERPYRGSDWDDEEDDEYDDDDDDRPRRRARDDEYDDGDDRPRRRDRDDYDDDRKPWDRPRR